MIIIPFHHLLARRRGDSRRARGRRFLRNRLLLGQQAIAANIRRARPRADCVWHIEEMVAWIRGKRMFM